MAFLQETPRSLRAYLLLVGTLGTAGQVYRVLLSQGGAFERLLALMAEGLIGLLVTLYLLRNVRRMAREARGSLGGP
jgi:hypothetical protein